MIVQTRFQRVVGFVQRILLACVQVCCHRHDVSNDEPSDEDVPWHCGLSIECSDKEPSSTYHGPNPIVNEDDEYLVMSMRQRMVLVWNQGEPLTPNMESFTQRISTFTGWRLKGIHRPTEMAKAGLFYNGEYF